MTNRKRIIAMVFMLLFVCLVGIAVQVVHRRKTARAFLTEAAALQLRVATLAQVEQLANRYGGHVEPSSCTSEGCAYFFSFDNGWLHRLRLAPYTRLTCTLGVADGVVVFRRVFLTSGNSAFYGAFIEERPSLTAGLREPFDLSRQWSGAPWRVYVNLTPAATLEQHRAAYNLNLDCLSRVGGCENAQRLLPSVTWPNSSSNGAALRYPTEASQ